MDVMVYAFVCGKICEEHTEILVANGNPSMKRKLFKCHECPLGRWGCRFGPPTTESIKIARDWLKEG